MINEYEKYFSDAITQGRHEDSVIREREENALNDIYDGVSRCEVIEF